MKIVLMLGGNMGDSAGFFRTACEKLSQHGVTELKCSSIFRSAAVDCIPGTPDFCDAAVTGNWSGSPEELLALCQKLEQEAGRPAIHSSRESRTLDIDIIFFGELQLQTPHLTIPHPRAALREFVLEPLCQLDPELIFPDSGLSVQETLKKLRFKH